MQLQKIEVSTTTILKILLLLLVFGLIFYLRDVILLLFLALIFMSAFNPWVDKLERGKVPRWLAILFFYLIFFSLLIIFLASVLPPFFRQTQDLARSLPNLLEQSVAGVNLEDFIKRGELANFLQVLAQNLSEQLVKVPSSIFKLGAGIFGQIVTSVSFFVITFYLLLGHRRIKLALSKFLHEKHQEKFLESAEKVEKKLGAWLRGELLLMLIIGFLTYLGLAFLIKLPFALPLAILAGFLEIIPILGPVFSAIPAIFVAAAFSPWKVLSVVLLYILIQQLENSLIVPKVMQKAVGLDPLLVLLALLIGGRLAGPLGALLAVPILATGVILLQVFYPQLGSNSKSQLKK